MPATKRTLRFGQRFTPASLNGLIAWYKPGEAGLVREQGMAAQFTAANSEYLSRADNAALSMGDIDFTIETWVYMDTTPTSGNAMTFLGKWENPVFEYVVACLNEAGGVYFFLEG